MNSQIRVPLITPIDTRCRKSDCSCVTSVPGYVLKDAGYTVAQEAGTICNDCNHPYEEHDVMGPSKKSDTERGQT